MTWHVNFVHSKDAQKQLARTSLTTKISKFPPENAKSKGPFGLHLVACLKCGEIQKVLNASVLLDKVNRSALILVNCS